MTLSVPDEGYSRNVPDEGYSRNTSYSVPDEGYSRNTSYVLKISTFLIWQILLKLHIYETTLSIVNDGIIPGRMNQ